MRSLRVRTAWGGPSRLTPYDIFLVHAQNVVPTNTADNHLLWLSIPDNSRDRRPERVEGSMSLPGRGINLRLG